MAEIAPQVYQVDLSDLADGESRIRVIHTSPDAPAVDIAVKGGDVLISESGLPGRRVTILVVPAGAYDLEVRPTGTMDVALDLPGVTLEAGMVYDVFAIGTLADGTLGVLVASLHHVSNGGDSGRLTFPYPPLHAVGSRFAANPSPFPRWS